MARYYGIMPPLNPDFATAPPAPPLRPYISHYVGFRASGLHPNVHSGLPSRHPGLVISLGDPIDLVRMPAAAQAPAAFTAFVSGLQAGPTRFRYGDRRDGLFVHLMPTGVRALLAVSSVELARRIVDLSDIWGRAAACLVERLCASSTWPQRFAIVDRVFLEALNPKNPAPELAWAWRRLAQAHGCVPVQKLAGEIGWSRQHFRERFSRRVRRPAENGRAHFSFRACIAADKGQPMEPGASRR